jgi:hypothetical protein
MKNNRQHELDAITLMIDLTELAGWEFVDFRTDMPSIEWHPRYRS